MKYQTQQTKTNENTSTKSPATTMRPAEGTSVLEAIITAREKACQAKNAIFLHMNGVVLAITPQTAITEAMICYLSIVSAIKNQATI